jgi:hypothetical protein
VPYRGEYCQKRTQRHRVCGQELLPNTKCPRGYLHAEAPRYPSLWLPVTILTLSVAALLCFLYGVLSFIGPFTSYAGATVGTTRLVPGARLPLRAGATLGLYQVTACTGEAVVPTIRLATLQGGGTSITFYPSVHQPTFAESTPLYPIGGVQRCASVTVPRTATYAVTYVSYTGGQLGLVPGSQLYRLTIYELAPWCLLAAVIGAAAYLVVVLRRRYSASDPSEQADLTHDTVAKIARANERFRARERRPG